LCLTALLLIAGAFILDDMAALLAGGTIIAAVLGQYIVFDTQVRGIVASVGVRRSLSRNPVRKGTALQVTTRFTFRTPSRVSVGISDLLPPNTILVDGITTVAAGPDPSNRAGQCRYRITPLAHGEQPFSGVSVQVRNFFFTTTIRLAREDDRKPVLSVLPTGLFQAPLADSAEGTRDNRKAGVWSSMNIHSLREYQPGDDLRHVDWKISAKFDKIFIRKYSSPMSHPPLIIVDLPWNGAPYPGEEFNRMITEVTGMVSHTLLTYQRISVLFISGPNVLHLIREERNSTRCIAELREWMHPAERPVHFYHMADRSDLRSQVRTVEKALSETADPRLHEYYELVRDRYLSVLQYQRNPAFSGQVARTLSQILMTEAFLFSLGCGDVSHIRHIVRLLQTLNTRVHVRIMGDIQPKRPAKGDSSSPAWGVRP